MLNFKRFWRQYRKKFSSQRQPIKQLQTLRKKAERKKRLNKPRRKRQQLQERPSIERLEKLRRSNFKTNLEQLERFNLSASPSMENLNLIS